MDSEPTQTDVRPRISRRQLIKSALGVAAGVGAAEVAGQAADHTTSRPRYGPGEAIDSIWIPEPLRIGKSVIQFVSIPHHEGKYTVDDIASFEAMLHETTESVIFEYFPAEYLPVIEKYPNTYGRSWAKLFEELAPIVARHNISVDVLDPAFDARFMLQLRPALQVIHAGVIGASFFSTTEITRRKLGIDASLTAALLYYFCGGRIAIQGLVSSLSKKDFHSSLAEDDAGHIEQDVRRVLVAEHLAQMCHEQEGRFVVAYPSVHAKQILSYLQDETLRSERLANYQEIVKIMPSATAFLTRRHYEHTNGVWHMTHTTHIDGESKTLAIAPHGVGSNFTQLQERVVE